MSRVRDVRERWITEVLRTDAVTDGCKVVLLAMSRHMTDRGRVSWPRERIAADVGLKTPQRVTNRIKEARDAGLLDTVHPGYRGMTAVYEAMLPTPKGADSKHPLGPKGNGKRAPIPSTLSPTQTAGKGADSEHPNARVTYKSREFEPAPVGRGVDATDFFRKDGSEDESLPTPSKRLSSVTPTKGEVA